jgi:hypothetical protein
MLEQDKNEKRIERHHITQEDFTPEDIVNDLLNKVKIKTYSGLTKKVIDPSCGIGNILLQVLDAKLKKTTKVNQLEYVLKTIYGVELMADNVEECREHLYNMVLKYYPEVENDSMLNFKVRSIIKNRIQWCDLFAFDFEHWPRLSFIHGPYEISFSEIPSKEDTKFPMWYKNKESE